MQVIFDVIGSPTKAEIAKVTHEKARNYLRNLPQRKPKNLKRMFPGSRPKEMDLFQKLLKFDVEKRISAQKCLKHPFFESVRDRNLEKGRNPVLFKDIDLRDCG